jgi:PPK2 family polyphosphate:nucleotide phosphotransferase
MLGKRAGKTALKVRLLVTPPSHYDNCSHVMGIADMSLDKKTLASFRITDGESFRLADHAPDNTRGITLKKIEAKAMLAEGIAALSSLQERLYADDRWSVLLIFQAMDAAGKDSTISHVMSGVNPQGCEVHSFKAPSPDELDHDFLWRTTCRLPQRGRIGIFNRSYYEEVLVVRVHPEFLNGQRLPDAKPGKKLWQSRYESIRSFETHMARNGTRVLKFFLHVSKDEQKRRQIERIDDPTKNWKFNARDVEERTYWKDYMSAYDDAIRATAQEESPWYVIPADDKWFMRVAVMNTIVSEMNALELDFPKLDKTAKAKLSAARKALESD